MFGFFLILGIIGFVLNISKAVEEEEKGEKREAYYPNGKLLARAYFNKKGDYYDYYINFNIFIFL